MVNYVYWECTRNKSLPKFNMFLQKVEAKQETEKVIASENKTLQDFLEKMGTIIMRYTYCQFSNPLQFFSVILRGESMLLAHSKSVLFIFVI